MGQERLRQRFLNLCGVLAEVSRALSNETGASAAGILISGPGNIRAVGVEEGLALLSGPKANLHLDPVWFAGRRVWGGEPRVAERRGWGSVGLCPTAISRSVVSSPALVLTNGSKDGQKGFNP